MYDVALSGYSYLRIFEMILFIDNQCTVIWNLVSLSDVDNLHILNGYTYFYQIYIICTTLYASCISNTKN